ncbi:ribosomal protein L17, partial [Geopyxis carbonaria]
MAKYPKHRMLNRTSAHRQALLRNLVTSLFTHESISTTYPKAKEAQRIAEKCITLAKRNSNASRLKAEAILYTPVATVPKLFGALAERYRDRPGGYTRVLRIEPLKTDQAPSAILELVDGPKDMRFAMTAKTVARCQAEDKDLNDLTLKNIRKVTRFRKDGEKELEKMV